MIIISFIVITYFVNALAQIGSYDLIVIPLSSLKHRTHLLNRIFKNNRQSRPEIKNVYSEEKHSKVRNNYRDEDRWKESQFIKQKYPNLMPIFDMAERKTCLYNPGSLRCSDNLFRQTDFKIVGGQEVDINLYPYHVSYGSNCGGAIIDKHWIITAGHCGKKTYVRVGSKYLSEGEKINVKRNYIHPKWSAANKEHPFDYDFQLVELNHPLKFSENVQPIKIAKIKDMVVGKVITVTGWGNTQENGPYSDVLRAVRVPIISKEECQRVPFPYFKGTLSSRMFCAGYKEGMKDACQGDSGGPAASNGRLLGMVSFGYGCATPGSYGVYSKVAKVRDWIEEVTGLRLE